MRFMRLVQVVLPILLISSLSCTGEKNIESNFTQLYPKITLSTESVEFQTVVLYDEDQEFQIINSGLAELEISDIRIDNNDDGMYTISPTTATINPNENLSVLVHFDPATYREYNREIVIVSNDPDNGELHLPLLGEGIDGPIPDIHISPRVLDFGTVAQGSSKTSYFTLSNQGTGDLLIESVTLEGSENFSLMTNISGVSYGLEQTANLVVQYTPTEETGENAVITITSNDPDEGEQTVTLLGNGGGAFEYPIAQFSCPSEVDPPTTIHLNGGNSYDPNGNEPLSYNWSILQKPPGSTTDIDEPTLSYTPFFVDVAGDYQLQLVVENSIGLESNPATCSFTAIPDESIHVELVWDKSNTDVDLHMVMEGYDFFSYDGDCCWCNPNPGWGNNGTADDPSLSLDNRIGYGPEAIEIYSPYDGSYNILVNYFNANGHGDTTATVRVYLDGVLISEVSRILSGRDLWDVGYIYWSNGTGQFVEQNETPEMATVYVCY